MAIHFAAFADAMCKTDVKKFVLFSVRHLVLDGYFPEILLACRIIHSSFAGRVSAP